MKDQHLKLSLNCAAHPVLIVCIASQLAAGTKANVATLEAGIRDREVALKKHLETAEEERALLKTTNEVRPQLP